MPFPPNVASKYVLTTAPVPPAEAGSSAPESVELTLTRKTLIAGASSSNGGVPENAVRKLPRAVLESACWPPVKPSASRTTLNARLRGAVPKIWVEPRTAPSAVDMAPSLATQAKRKPGEFALLRSPDRLTRDPSGRLRHIR